MKVFYTIFIISLFLLSCNRQEQERKKTLLNSEWKFKSTDDSIWRNAEVPGVIHLDLYKNNIIPNPFDSTNESQLQWIGEKDWEYQYSFDSKDILDYQHAELVFDGLDTYADVFINDSLILSTDNMYRKWRIPIKHIIHKGHNTVRIVFYAPEKIIKQKATKLSYKLPDERGFARKAPYQFGWDWGAKFLTAGIWKEVYIDYWDNSRIDNIHIIQNEVDTALANMEAIININSATSEEYIIEIIDNKTNKTLISQPIKTKKREEQYAIAFNIHNPKLWWCNGMGKANLYELRFKLLKNEHTIDEVEERIGIRTIELVQKEDSIGKSFYFELNGKPVFIKGANYVPADNFLPRITKNTTDKIIDAAVWANFNMLRVWGGGIYESDDFYNYCDETGIMVWQDFMFACNMYPGDSAFIRSVKHEAIDNIIRLRNHASLALWCGNNEVDNGWKDWGWQKQLGYSESDSTEIWENYLNIFENILPEMVANYDGKRNYHPSSPTYGWGHEENFTHGDSHYWGVWWGHEPFDVFDTKVGRFMSEYGFQALPNIKSIKQFANNKELHLSSQTMKAHQKHPTGYETINEYLQRDYKTTDNFEDYIYLSQLTQAYGITKAIEAHRRNKPYCMGTLYWQLNDAWPVTSWSSVDYYGRKKALHYFIKKAYKETIISCATNADSISIFLISDNEKSQNLNVSIQQINYYGEIISSKTITIKIDNTKSHLAYNIPKNIFNNKPQSFSYITAMQKDSLISERFYYPKKPKYMKLPKAIVNTKINEKNGLYYIIVSSNVLAKNIEIIPNIEGSLSDNYFDLLPNENKKIVFTPSEKGVLHIKTRTLNNLYRKQVTTE